MKAQKLPVTESGVRIFCGFLQLPHVLPKLCDGWRSIHGLYLLLRAFERGNIEAYVVADETERLVSIGWFVTDGTIVEVHFASIRGADATESAKLSIGAMCQDHPNIKTVRANIPVSNRPARLLCRALGMKHVRDEVLGEKQCRVFEIKIS